MNYKVRIVFAAVLLGLLTISVNAAELPGPQVPTRLSDAKFQVWAQNFNKQQYELSARRAIPGPQVTVDYDNSTSTTSGGGVFTSGYDYAGYGNRIGNRIGPGFGNGFGNGIGNGYGVYVEPTTTNTSRTSGTRTWNIRGYGGGPVWIINPFVNPRSSK